MNTLTVIQEEIEEQIPEECSEIVQRLKDDLAQALKKIEDYEEKLSYYENSENKAKELTSLCQSKNAEVFALERKVKDLILKNEEKDKQIISMLSMNMDFKLLVESAEKGIQTEWMVQNNIEEKLAQTEMKNVKLKEMFISQIEEIQKLKTFETSKELPQFIKKKVDNKMKPGGYYPLFLRKPKDGSITNM